MLPNFNEVLFCKRCFHDERLAITNQCDCRVCIWNSCGRKIINRMPLSMNTRMDWKLERFNNSNI